MQHRSAASMAKRPRPYKQMPFCPRETFFWTLPLLFVALDKYNFGMHVTLKTTWKLLWKEKVSGGGFMQHKVILMMQAYKIEPLFPLQKISHVTFWSKVSIYGVLALWGDFHTDKNIFDDSTKIWIWREGFFILLMLYPPGFYYVKKTREVKSQTS